MQKEGRGLCGQEEKCTFAAIKGENNRIMTVYRKQYTVVASDMDVTYRMTPNAVMLYFQDAFARCLTARRLAAFDLVQQQLLWVITGFEVDYCGERPLWSDEVGVEIRFSAITPVRTYVAFRLYDAHNGLFAEGNSCWVLINSVTKRPCAVQPLLAAAGITADGEEVPAMDWLAGRPGSLAFEVKHQVNVTDLDFNGHVCNRSYLSIAMATAPLDFVRSAVPRQLKIRFLREAFMGEELTCSVFSSPAEPLTYWHEIGNAQGKAVCSICSRWEPVGTGGLRDVAELVTR